MRAALWWSRKPPGHGRTAGAPAHRQAEIFVREFILEDVLYLATGRMTDNDERPRHHFIEKRLNAFGDDAKRIDRVANTGFIGRHVVRRLASSGPVRAFDVHFGDDFGGAFQNV